MRGPVVRAAVLRGEAHGVVFEARVDDPRLLPDMRARLPPGWSASRLPPTVVLSLVHEVFDDAASRGRRRRVRALSVRLDGQVVAHGLTHVQALDVFES